MEEIITFPVWIIPIPALKTSSEALGTKEKHFAKEDFYQRPGSGRNNSISCLDYSISCLEN